jgi:hypothetical protein
VNTASQVDEPSEAQTPKKRNKQDIHVSESANARNEDHHDDESHTE